MTDTPKRRGRPPKAAAIIPAEPADTLHAEPRPIDWAFRARELQGEIQQTEFELIAANRRSDQKAAVDLVAKVGRLHEQLRNAETSARMGA
jgi:hypothetical protein